VKKTRYFLSGWILAVASEGLYQDLLGQRRYLQMVQTSWVSGWFTVPLELGLIGWALWMVAR
jgi:hypothetical protein